MKSEVRDPSIYQKQSGIWTVDYIDPLTLNRHRRQAKTKREALLLRDEIAKKIEVGEPLNLKGIILFGEAMSQHIDECPNTKVTAVAHRFTSLYDHFKMRDVKKISTDDLRNWMDNILTPAHNNSSGGETGLADKSKKKARDQINHFFKWCLKKEYVRVNPCTDLRYKDNLKQRRRQRVHFTPEELKLLMSKMKEFSPDHLYPIAMIQLHTGSRLGETVRLKWANIDFAAGTICFPSSSTKNKQEREISMSPQLRDLLKGLPRKKDRVFVNGQGKPVSVHRVGHLIKKFREFFPYHEEHGPRKKFSSHALRHSFARNFLMSGRSSEELKAILGKCLANRIGTKRQQGGFRPTHVACLDHGCSRLPDPRQKGFHLFN